MNGSPVEPGRRNLRRAAIATSLLSLASCMSDSPEDRLRGAIQQAEAAVETGDFARLRELISPRFSDAAGRDDGQLVETVRAYLFGLGSIYVLSKEQSFELSGPCGAEVTMLVAVASVPFETFADLERASAEVVRVELSFEDDDGQWKLLRAEWTPARLTDVL